MFGKNCKSNFALICLRAERFSTNVFHSHALYGSTTQFYGFITTPSNLAEQSEVVISISGIIKMEVEDKTMPCMRCDNRAEIIGS